MIIHYAYRVIAKLYMLSLWLSLYTRYMENKAYVDILYVAFQYFTLMKNVIILLKNYEVEVMFIHARTLIILKQNSGNKQLPNV